ncbi:MAG TPA: amino acid adenylation domain-containing protein [Candidatus Deferrimicrobium sp.]|nr:amino acid adenylation domain-containing protein [Candidatus Deferrimicrobium sp.]
MEFLGRIDQQVKIRGFRIELAEIEKSLTKHEDIKEALVTVIKNSSSNEDKLLCAYFTGSRKFDVSELREYLGRELAGYMIPAYFEQLETIPLTINGKVDRRALPAPSLSAAKNYIAPGDSIEEKIVEIWSNVLGVKKETIGVQDDFFHRGGHSLKAMLLVSQLAKTLNVEFPLITIFKGPTVREMANTVRKSRKINYEGIKPVEKKEYYPLASAQRRLFFLEQLEDIGVTYNIPSVLKIEGKLDIKQFEQAVNKLLQRHETLRTSFRLIKNEPVQIVHENVNFKIEHYHCSDSPLPVIKDFIRPFDLSCAPLLHVGIVFLSTGEYLLLYDFHHIISDGTSIGILTDDFQALYDGRELPPLKHQYKDFSAWQNNLFETGKIEKQAHYWLECFSGQIPVLNLPTDYPRPGSLNFEGKTIGARLEEETASALKRFCLESGTTLYMNLLAVLNVLLYKYTHQSDIVVGAAVMGRPHSDLRRLIGMFVNSLAMRNFPDGEKQYAVFLEEVKETCLNAFENQDVQFEWLVDRLKIKRDPSRNPLFDILLVVQNYEQATTFEGQGQYIPGELKFSAYPVENTTSKFDFNFSIWENGNTITFSLEYASKMYASSTARKILSNYLNILEQLIKNQDPGLLLMDVDILSEDEKRQLLVEFNDTVTPWPKDKTVYGLFGEIVSKNPDYPALIDPLTGTVTYCELNQRVNRLANYLSMEKNIRADNRVGLLMDKSIDCIVALLAIQAAGGGYVPINPGLPEERIVEIIEDADIEVLISEKKYIKILNRLQWECRGLHTFLCMDSPDVYKETEEQSGLMDKKLWEYVGESAEDDITGGGWKSSYTGLPISKEEMAEYSHNALEKVRPLLHKNARVLEIGCATGLTMYLVAPQVGLYYGTDLSSVIIARNMERIKVQGHSNIRLECLPAHEIDKIAEKDFDLIILNSVVQHFSGYNYLREIIKKAIALLGRRGVIFIGDVMDMDRKAALIKDLIDFKKTHQRSGYRTKTDWSEELFISQSFFHDLSADIPAIRDVAFSKKIGVIENELTKFRYDVLVTVDKTVGSAFTGKLNINVNKKHKYQDDRRALARQSNQTCLSHIEPHHLLYIIYTSGTTGKPKGVMIEHRNVVRLMSNDRFSFDFTNRDVWTMFHSYNFDFSVWEMYGALLFGGKLIIIPQMTARDTAEYLTILLREGVTILNQTPSAFYRLMDEESNRLGGGLRLRYVIFGGEALNLGMLKNFNKKYPVVNLVNMYGITETTVHVTYKKITPVEIESGGSNIGTPIPTLRVYIMDRDFNVIPVGAAGELYIGGDGVARGYLNRPELTSARFTTPTPIKSFRKSRNPFSKGFLVAEGTLYKSGDLGRYLPNGDIEYLGRIDQQVKIRGFRLELGEIESHLRNHGEVKEAFVMARDDGYGERYLCAYMVDEGKLDAQVLKEYLKKKLPDYMIPTYFVSLAKIPLTVNGKLDVRALPEPAAIEAGNNYIAPHDLIELKLVEIWSEVLKINQSAIGIDDDFFALGGHSLRATSVISDIHKELNIKVPLAEIFKTPTIRELAEYIKDKNEDKFISIPPAEKKEYYALSPAQNRLYILQQMKEDSIGYNEYAVLELIGKVDKNKLEETFKKLITRHESFRTYFVKVGDYIVQRIAREVDFGVDYAEMPGERLEGIIAQFIRPFDLEKAPLLRVKLVRLDRERYWLIYDIHHIITDGTSMAVLMKEFAVLYTGKLLGPLGIQYKDFSQWQNSPAGKEMLKGQESYWLEEFNGEIPVLELNTDYPRPEFQEFAGERIHFVLGKEETRALKTCASNHDVTLFMLLLGVYNVLFSRLSGQEDIVVGTPIAARRHADLQRIIGMFVNTLALRNYPVGNKRFSDFLTEIKINTLKAFENQEYPFEELVEKVRVQRSLGRNPLFDIIFAVQNMESHAHDIPEAQIEDIELKWPEFPRKISKFDLSMHVMNEAGEILLFTLEYSTSLFKKETVERFYGYFIQVALAAAAGPLKKIHELEIISNQEKEHILYHFNATASEYPREKTVHRLFEAQVSRTPDRIVIIGPVGHVGPVSLSYRELHTRSDCLAGLLSEKGVLADSIVAIKMACSLEMIIAILAILKAGAAYLPIDPNYPQERIDYMLNDSAAKIILTAAECVFNFHHSSFIIHHSSPLAYIIYTSGTTGRPKGVMIEHHSLVNLCYWHNRYYKVNASDRASKYAGIGFDASVWEIFPYLLTGASLCIIDEEIKLDINELNRYFERYNITIGFLPTQVCEQFLELENRSLRKLLTGGDKLRHFKKKRYDVYNNYGPTENTVVSTSYWVEENCHNIPIGKPMANTGIYILDPGKMNLQPIGVPGELCVGGGSLSRGYLNNPELTAEKFVINSLSNFTSKKLYKTGDRARWSEDGNIEFLGRIDFQVKVRGNRIELGEIETLLLKHEKIKDAVVTAIAGPNGDTYLCTYVVSETGIAASGLREYLEKYLPGYMIPSYFVWLDRIPLTSNGKVDRNALPAPVITTGQNYIAPRDGVEEKLVEIWSEVLGIEKSVIGIDSNFFDLGGHSLKATIVVSKIHMMLNVKVPLPVMFRDASIRELGGYIKTLGKSKYAPIDRVEEKEYYDISHAQKRLWIIEQMKENQTAYNIPITFQLEGPLDIRAFELALLTQVERHESLRTVFITIGGEPKQKIIASGNTGFKLDYIDFRSRVNPIKAARELVRQELKTGFDLEKGPLVRAKLLHLEEEKYVFQLILHHIIADGWSMNVLFSELINIYINNKASGEHTGSQPEPLRIQYKDYTAWQNKQVTGAGVNPHREYWLRQFSGKIPVIKLTTDKRRPAVKDFNGKAIDFIIDNQMKMALDAIAHRTGASLFMILLALVNLLLRHYTGQEEFVIGSPVAGRQHNELENQVGFYVNTLPFRIDMTGIDTFAALLQKIKQTSLDAYEYQAYPFDLLVEELGLINDPGRNPLFDVMMVLQNNDYTPYPIPVFRDLQISSFETRHDTSTFELNFHFTQLNDHIYLNLIYDSDLFEEITIRVMGMKLLNLIRKVINMSDIRVKDITPDDLLPTADNKKIGTWDIEF